MGKRGTNHTWQLVKYHGDIAIYAKCNSRNCGFSYPCSEPERNTDGTWNPCKQIPTKFYSYCPQCGARKKWYDEHITYIDNNRNIVYYDEVASITMQGI